MIAIFAMIDYYFIPNNQVVPPFRKEGINLVIDGVVTVQKEQPKVMNGEVLLPFDTIKAKIDNNIFWDSKLEKVTVTTDNRVVRMRTGSLSALVNNNVMTLNLPVSQNNGIILIPINFLSDLYDIDIVYSALNKVVIIDHKKSIVRYAVPVSTSAVVRNGCSIRSPIIYKPSEFSYDVTQDNSNINGTMLRIYGAAGNWYKVRTTQGVVGFVEKRYVSIKSIKTENTIDNPQNIIWKPYRGKINLVWEMMYEGKPDLSAIKGMKGLDVISPTWFQLQNEKGDVINRSNGAYVEWAHKKGYKIWALLSNGFEGEMTGKFLSNTDYRDNLIRQILTYSELYKLDGINIDFEDIRLEDKPDLTQFIREITPLLREQGLVVSIDINTSASYDTKALADIADYIMVMTYDQHWRTSPVAGSVAQITWVESLLIKYLDVIPKEKLLVGLPFYTRLWKESTDANGNVVVSCESLKMEEARTIIKENNAKVAWDKESGQFYAEYKKSGAVYKIWVEDKNSLDLKSSLSLKYQLAGTAAWSRTFETPDIWELLNSNLKEIGSYSEWALQNKNKTYVYK